MFMSYLFSLPGKKELGKRAFHLGLRRWDGGGGGGTLYYRPIQGPISPARGPLMGGGVPTVGLLMGGGGANVACRF